MKPLTRISIYDVETRFPTEPVFVVNTTRGNERGVVALVLDRVRGNGSDTVNIPMTWIPMELTASVSRQQVLESTQFRQGVNSGKIAVVDPIEAMALLRDNDEAKKEYMRLRKLQLRDPTTPEDIVPIYSNEKEGEPDVPDGTPTFVVNLVQSIIALAGVDDSKDKSEAIEGYATKLRNAGDLPYEVLQYVHRKLKKVAPDVAAIARLMAGK